MSWREHHATFDEALKELDRFFQGKDRVHRTLRKVVRRLKKAGISYAVMGGLAVFFQGHERASDDVDLLLTEEGLAEFRRRFVPKHYKQDERLGRHFKDLSENVGIDIRVTGRYPGNGKPGPIAFPDPAAVGEVIDNKQILKLSVLVELKLAARRFQDLADVISLMRVHDLNESFQDRLHTATHATFLKCLDARKVEDENEAYQDSIFRARANGK